MRVIQSKVKAAQRWNFDIKKLHGHNRETSELSEDRLKIKEN